MAHDASFLSRWSRRKSQERARERGPRSDTDPALRPPSDVVPPVAAEPESALPPDPDTDPAPGAAPPPATVGNAPAATGAAHPAPTLEEVGRLTPDSDYARFVTREVEPEVRNAALRKLFTDPHFNVMDGLDTYVDDYHTPDPLPAGMLRRMVQSQLLGIFADEETAGSASQPSSQSLPRVPSRPAAGPPAATAFPPPDATTLPTAAAHEDTDLQLQPDDDAGCAGAEPRPGADPGREP